MQAIEAPLNAVLKMRRKNRRRLYMLIGVLMFFYYEAVTARVDSISRVFAMMIRFVAQQVRVFKPKSKRL